MIGGSIAKTLKKFTDWEIIGFDNNELTLSEALKTNAVDSIWDGTSEADADITVLCTSPETAVDLLNKMAKFLKPG